MKHHAPRLTKTLSIFLIVLAALAGSCVTVNVNLPESAVQRATDDYVKDLYRARDKGKADTKAAPAAKPQSYLGIFMAEAWAVDDITFTVDTQRALVIREKLRARVDDVLSNKRSGILGETKDGKLVLKKTDPAKKLLMKKLEKLVTDENHDRDELYSEIVKSNKLAPARLKDIQRSFARSFQSESPSGTWIEDQEGVWSQKQ
ncbi:MAG: hypothetical protein A2583_14495 [Bdellovibrionales bacterium RIFOXYD1_FULL_53_11]|nr:MAG: hypothetical protein A2583_14495 [Bdellovibrionales bacterium RIFOXYD1_FULL_53_11]